VGIAYSNVVAPEIASTVSNNNPHFMCELGGQTYKNESLADDNTTILLLAEDNLANLRKVLNDFGDRSGLRCNFDKTTVLPVGKTQY
jgi:hypothetical protein